MDVAIRLVRYVKRSPGFGILLSANSSIDLTAFCDADWASCPNTRKSITGFLVKFGDSLILWRSKKQSTISRSSTEAEYRSLASTVAEIVWQINLFKVLDIPVSLPVPIHSDSKSAL
ncbi:uncharacterized mitochondrial protein AtMg00810-like [Capsicum annuum]|uniref:uncharacterized mitochondrial protein AtMg00810-like n=1 Tax=Capsicum annuum TaxID=4072 RepID=UPI001FB0F619|nr:uncharacterized mitochondrial protein AtMg00810-like [Capsicum annuum]